MIWLRILHPASKSRENVKRHYAEFALPLKTVTLLAGSLTA